MTASLMQGDKFWQIVKCAAESDHDPDAHAEVLRAELRELSLQEIISFEVAFRRYLNEAYTWDLWGAAYPRRLLGRRLRVFPALARVEGTRCL